MSDSDVQPLVTQCPSCHTQFRVGESQLQVAGGKVRCGACLTVFQGVDNLVWDGAEAPAAKAASDADSADLDGLFDDVDDLEPAADTDTGAADDQTVAPAAAGEADPVSETETTSVLGAPNTEADTEADIEADTATGTDTDAAISEAPEADEPVVETLDAADDIEAPPRRTLEITLDELEAQLLSGEPLQLPVVHERSAEPAAADDDELIPGEDQKAVTRVASDAAASAAEPGAADPAPPDPRAVAEPVASSTPARAGSEPTTATATEDEPAAAVAADDPFAQLRSDAPREIDDPFERLAAKQRETEPALPIPGRSIWPTVGIAVGVLLLIGQVLFLRFGAWTQNPQVRPLYEVICSVLPCTVPPLKALEYMEVVKKSARSHPSVDNALQIDMVIANRAPFAQSFPLLEIVFTDFNNEVVAGRRFTPAEYLAGELKGQTEIAAQTPVRVQLEIQDLGDDAINYNITFR